MINIGGPRQVKSAWRWIVRQMLVYAAMPFRPLLSWLLNLTDHGY